MTAEHQAPAEAPATALDRLPPAARPQGLIGHIEAAEYLDVPPATLYQWNYHGTGPRSYKIGRHRKYRLADLDAFIEVRSSDHRGAA